MSFRTTYEQSRTMPLIIAQDFLGLKKKLAPKYRFLSSKPRHKTLYVYAQYRWQKTWPSTSSVQHTNRIGIGCKGFTLSTRFCHP